MGNRAIGLLSCVTVFILLAGCGSTNMTTGTTPSTGTTTPTPGAGSTSSVVQYEAATDANIGTGAAGTGHITGQITVSTTGSGAMDIHDPVANASFKINWCNFPGTTGCFDIGTFNADSSGEVKNTFAFPMHGSFAGVFGLTEGGVNQFSAGFDIPNGSTPFQAALLPAASITAGLGAFAPQFGVGNDTISSGSVAVAAGASTAHLVLQGVPANQTYSAMFCSNGALPSGSGCTQSANFSSDGSGNAAVDMTPGTGVGKAGVFLVQRRMVSQAPIEFVSGFRVP
jgi:hypothetical protein